MIIRYKMKKECLSTEFVSLMNNFDKKSLSIKKVIKIKLLVFWLDILIFNEDENYKLIRMIFLYFCWFGHIVMSFAYRKFLRKSV